MDISYIINHLGEEHSEYYNAVSPPIAQTSNYIFANTDEFRKSLEDEKENFIYSRGKNPTLDILSKKLAALEETEDALVFASGMAAISTAIISCVKAGDHIICIQNPYSWTNKLLNSFLPSFNVKTTFVDGKNPENFKKAIQKSTKLIYLESPNSFTFELQDITEVSLIAKENGIVTAIDNSYSSPLAQKPAKLGIDIVLHSASKYLGGHSDIVAGVLCSSKKIITQIFNKEYLNLGGIISPFNAWLMIRGLRTLPIRIEKITRTTAQIVNHLENHNKVKKVIYPFSRSHPQYELAKKQMKFGLGLFTIELRTKEEQKIAAFCNNLKYFLQAVSWGGHESLCFPSFVLENKNIPMNLVRFYIGLDEADVLIQDLENAFEFIG